MFSDNTLLASLVLCVLALPAQAEGLDLSYPMPALAEATASSAAEQEPTKFHLEFKAPITLEHACSGPQCNYETDPSQRHEPETVNRWSVGFN
ncbi:hypothetical protein [Pseudomonas chlororaphis]|uniref:hypothetical protein n=1 Tax=Pseudomonas chlororaphis TaxID=587753 RepID=UPI0024082105|nr:hypothetical protein [Pseudomonas chlororaphis]